MSVNFDKYFRKSTYDDDRTYSWIFARRAMADQAREGLCYQRELNIFVYILNIKKLAHSVLAGFILRKLLFFSICFY